MPYADPEKQREADRKRKARARAEKKAEESEEVRERKPDVRARAWTFIVYPESAPENWRDVLDRFHLQWACSPLHDRDVNATGEPKRHTGTFPVLRWEKGLRANLEYFRGY